MSSEFLNKSGLSYFFGKIKEMLQGKQDKLTAGDNITIADNVISATAGDKNVYFATTQGATYEDRMYKVKVSLKDWKGNFGDILYLQFQNEVASTTALYMVINSENPKRIIVNASTSDVPGRLFRAHEVVGFVVDTNNRFQMLDHSTATSSYYGLTRLRNEIWDDATTAITPHAVQTALADKQDKLYAGDNITIGTDNKIEAYNKVYVGTCATSESEDVKEVSCPEWILAGGNIIVVNFVNGNMSSTPSLNVEGSGATEINWNNAKHMWQADSWVAFAFDENVNQFYAINMEKADDNKYGVVQLSDYVDMESGISDGRAATPFAVKKAYDLANLGNKVFYATCSSAQTENTKEITIDDWRDKAGDIVVVMFENTNNAGTLTLKINHGDTSTSATLYFGTSATAQSRIIGVGEPIAIAWNGQYFDALGKGPATTNYYGVTRLSASVNTGENTMAVTPSAVRTALNAKQDTLTAGSNITIENNVISANVEMNLSTYAYDIAEESVGESGYAVSIKPNGMSMEYSGYDAWTLTIKKQRFIATDFTSVNPVVVNLACELDVGNGETYDIVVPCRLKAFFENTMLISCDMFEMGNRCETLNGSTIIQYHTFSNSSGSLTVTERTKLV